MAKPNIKELVVNHFEKAIFGLACLFAVIALATSRWVPYGHHPNEITQKVQAADKKIAAKTWPEEEQQTFVVPEDQTVEKLVARNIRRQVDPTPYEFDVSFSPGLYDTTKPITEPEFVTVGALIADSGRFLMAVQPEQPDLEESEDPELMAEASEEEDDQSEIPEEFRVRTNVGPGAGAGGLEGFDDAGMAGMRNMEGMMGMMGGRFGEMMGYGEESYDDYGGYDGMYGEAYGEMGMGGMGTNMEGRGLRYVAVRGIVPLREQIRKFMKALHVRSFTQAATLYEIIEFELERKKMQPGDDPWAGDWEPVDIDIAKDILNESLSFDPEVVQTAITDTAITMPLPGRLMGVWKSKATHPQLENFTLSPEEIEKEVAFNRMLIKQYEEQAKNAPEEAVKKGGFSDIAHNPRSMQMGAFDMMYGEGEMESYDYEDYGDYGEYGDYGGGMMGINYAPTSTTQMTKEAQDFIKELEAAASDEERDKALVDYIKERITAQGELLLFRYFDFDVEPGATYKYRARLIVKNPNYGLPIAQVAGLAHIVEGQTRKSDWSNETNPVTVPQDVDYFVAKIDEKGSGMAEARMAVFQWNPEYGTTIHDSLEVTYGEEIGGPKNTFILDPAKNRFEIEPYKFHTGDVLVDAFPEGKVSRNEHPDLELPRSARGSLGISGQVLISKGDGELAVIDQLSRISALQARRQYLEWEQQPFEEIKNLEAKVPDVSDLEAGYAEYGMEMMGYGEMDDYGGMMGSGMMGMMGFGSDEDYGRGRRRGSGLRKSSRSRR